MEEHHDLRGGSELVEELDKDQWSHVANLVKEDPKAFDVGKCISAEDGCEAELAILALGDQMCGLEAVLGFRFPLLFFAEAPEDEDAGQDDRKK